MIAPKKYTPVVIIKTTKHHAQDIIGHTDCLQSAANCRIIVQYTHGTKETTVQPQYASMACNRAAAETVSNIVKSLIS